MKTALKVSLMLNLVLAGCLICKWAGWRRETAEAGGLKEIKTNVLAIAVAAPVNLPPAEPAPFRWDQLDAKDYHVYVKNLRDIGCPEPTVRAIVTADVAAVYHNYGQQLKEGLAKLENGSLSNQLSSFNSEQAMKAELQRLPDEEVAKINDLLGLKTDPEPGAVASVAEADLSVPLVLQNVDLAGLDLSDSQKQVIADLRGDFIRQMGGTNQDLNDPAYVARWREAQPAADNMLEAMLGNDAYTKYEIVAHQNALGNQGKTGE